MGKFEDIEVAPDAPDLGELIGQCGPQDSSDKGVIKFIIVFVVMGILAIIAPYTFLPPNRPADAAGLQMITVIAAGFFFFFAAGFSLLLVFSKPQVVFLFENGLVDRNGNKDQKVLVEDIEKMKLFEWYDNRFAEPDTNVVLILSGGDELRFSSKLQGDVDAMIEYLSSHVPETEFIPFQA